MPGSAEVVAAVAAYLLGAIPSGVIIGRLRGVDPRAAGSGRTGTTNALRTLGPRLAALVLVIDLAKGVLAVLVGAWLAVALSSDVDWSMAIGGVAAVVGHIRSVFIGFGGGRGVATGGGVMLLLAPLALAAAIPAFIAVVWLTRYVSLASIAAAVVLPLAVVILQWLGRVPLATVVAAAVIGALVVVAHADNITRLRAGTERKLGRG